MFCPKCGNLLNDNEKYCRSCGAKIERDESSESKVNAPCDHPHRTTELPPVTLGEAFWLFFSRYTDFRGRSRRSEFWGAQLFLIVVEVIMRLVFRDGGIIPSLWSLVTFLPGLSISIRRLHDVGKSWVWYLWNLLPVAGQIILLVQYCTDGEPHANAWGESPKYVG